MLSVLLSIVHNYIHIHRSNLKYHKILCPSINLHIFLDFFTLDTFFLRVEGNLKAFLLVFAQKWIYFLNIFRGKRFINHSLE